MLFRSARSWQLCGMSVTIWMEKRTDDCPVFRRMWDADGPVIADAFYRELFTGRDGCRIEIPDTSKSAKALWIAVNELRAKGVEFRRWVPFIHMGK